MKQGFKSTAKPGIMLGTDMEPKGPKTIVLETGEEIDVLDKERDPRVLETAQDETECLHTILDELFTDIDDHTELSICNLNQFLQNHHRYSIQLLRNSPILRFLDTYFEHIWAHDKPTSLFQKAALVLSQLLLAGVYSPTQICTETPFLALFQEKSLSDDESIEIAVANFYTACVQENDIPEVVIHDFFDMAVTCTTTFHSLCAKRRSFYFLDRCLRYGKDIPAPYLEKVNALIREVLRNKTREKPEKKRTKIEPVVKKTLQALRPSALMLLRTEMQFYPDQYPNAIPFINWAKIGLGAAEKAIVVGCYRLFSVLFRTDSVPMEDHLDSIDCSSIVQNIDSVEEEVATEAVNLIISICGRGTLFADCLVLRDNLVLALDDAMSINDRTLAKKMKLYDIARYILLCGEGESCVVLFTSPFFSTAFEELESLANEERFFNFLDATLIAMEKVARIGKLLHVRTALDELGIFVAIMNRILEDPPSERCRDAVECVMKHFAEDC